MYTKQQQTLSTKAKQNNYKTCHSRRQCCHDSHVCPVVTTSLHFTSSSMWPHSRVIASRNSYHIPNPLTVNGRPDVLNVWENMTITNSTKREYKHISLPYKCTNFLPVNKNFLWSLNRLTDSVCICIMLDLPKCNLTTPTKEKHVCPFFPSWNRIWKGVFTVQ
jgi:hypothetical protein